MGLAAACDIIDGTTYEPKKSFKPILQPNTMPPNEQSFLNHPPALEGPKVPYKYEDQVLPVFRGVPLAIGATL